MRGRDEDRAGEGATRQGHAAERRLLDALDMEGLVEAVRALVAVPSWGGNETPAQELVARLMAEAGLAVDLWEIDLEELARHPAYSTELERERPLGVVGTLRGRGDGATLILNGHVDVVPPGDEALWTHPPFGGVVEGGHIHGRGALDTKAGLLAGLFAMRAVRDAGVALAGDVHLQSVVGEEDGGLGTLAAVLRGYTGDGAVVMEPTGLAVAPAQAGAFNFRLRVPGRAAHGAVREEGVSAIENAMVLYRAILDLESARNHELAGDPLYRRYRMPFPICVGTIRGGDWASSVPDHAALEGRYGVAPGEDADEACRTLEAAVAEAAREDPFLREHPPVLDWWGGRYRAARTDPDHRLVRLLSGAYREIAGREVSLEGMTYGSDMGLLAGVGRTTTVLFGPGDIRRAHRPDESVAVADVELVARSLALLLLRFCGTA